jgi:hypothetical protein
VFFKASIDAAYCLDEIEKTKQAYKDTEEKNLKNESYDAGYDAADYIKKNQQTNKNQTNNNYPISGSVSGNNKQNNQQTR